MSNVIFPKIRGLGWEVVKNPTLSTDIQSSLAGREVRIQNFQNPIWEFTLSYEYLLNDPKFRDDTGSTPLEQLIGFFLQRGGQFDDFLLNESDLTQRLEDSVYSGQPIGTGDGVTLNFQIARNFGGFLEACQNPAAVNIYVANVKKVPVTDYAISLGVVTFTVAPGAAAAITADFTFLHRVRFDLGTARSNSSASSGTREGIEFSNFYYQLYECKEVQLITVRK